ncbi:MAG: hypothetical protein OQK82_08465 [Candidatus Pacearchaeota archaeon]|nr:hypothetical protein [Candidatus Pacearchaeota archaeon]
MSQSCVHDFHFVLNRGMREKLKNLNFSNKSNSISGMIVVILKKLIPVIRKEHKWGEQRMSRYMAVCDDPEEIREHTHIYVPDELYRELKLLHQDLNFYSIAQLLRWLFDLFLSFVDVYKDDVFKELEIIFARWRSEDSGARLTSRKFMRQLWKIIRFLPGKNRLVTVHNNDFSPFWILRI